MSRRRRAVFGFYNAACSETTRRPPRTSRRCAATDVSCGRSAVRSGTRRGRRGVDARAAAEEEALPRSRWRDGATPKALKELTRRPAVIHPRRHDLVASSESRTSRDAARRRALRDWPRSRRVGIACPRSRRASPRAMRAAVGERLEGQSGAFAEGESRRRRGKKERRRRPRPRRRRRRHAQPTMTRAASRTTISSMCATTTTTKSTSPRCPPAASRVGPSLNGTSRRSRIVASVSSSARTPEVWHASAEFLRLDRRQRVLRASPARSVLRAFRAAREPAPGLTPERDGRVRHLGPTERTIDPPTCSACVGGPVAVPGWRRVGRGASRLPSRIRPDERPRARARVDLAWARQHRVSSTQKYAWRLRSPTDHALRNAANLLTRPSTRGTFQSIPGVERRAISRPALAGADGRLT